MGIESASSSHREPEHVTLPFNDEAIAAAMSNEQEERSLLEIDAVLWLRGAIALDTQRGASEISDRELSHRYHRGGRFEWDPLVSKAVKSYLKGMGFFS